jgi:tetrahydromethanopterin S-methyltransferase subunit C
MENSTPQRTRAPGDPRDESAAELLQRLSDQTTTLARKEVELAKAELTQKGKQVGVGAGAFGGAGAIGFYALGAFTAAAIAGLAEAVDLWLAALIVGLVYAAVAGVLALIGKNKVEEGSPPVPERAIESAKRDVEAAKSGAREGRSNG